MRIRNILVLASLAAVCLTSPAPAQAGKPSGGGGGIKVEELLKPAGSVEAYASDINDNGTVAVGAAYWDATWDHTNDYYAVRWTRSSTTGAWVAENLRERLPQGTDSRAYLVNDAGTIVFLSYRTAHRYVLTAAGDVIDLGTCGVADLSNFDTMVGSGGTTQSVPLFWASPSSAPAELPPLADGYAAGASQFQGADVVGWADDASGRWMVRWVYGAGDWSVSRIVLLPASASPGSLNSAGRMALSLYAPSGGGQYAWDRAPAAWDPPYTQAPAVLPTSPGAAGNVGAVLEDGTVSGAVTANSKTMTNWLPVIWPTPTTLVQLPLLRGAKYGVTASANAYRQIAGSVSVVDKWGTNEHAVIWTLP